MTSHRPENGNTLVSAFYHFLVVMDTWYVTSFSQMFDVKIPGHSTRFLRSSSAKDKCLA